MHYQKLVFFQFLILLLALCQFSHAQDKKAADSPIIIQQCWQFNTTEQISVKPTVLNDKVFLPLANGNLLALNTATGETLWRTELGGEIVGQMTANDNTVFVPTQVSKEKQNSVVIRALSAETGVTAWQGELPQTSGVRLALRENILLALVNDENNQVKIIALSTNNGELIWTQTISAKITTALLVNGNTVYFAAEDKTVRVHSVVDGKETRQIRLPQAANGSLILAENILFVSDAAGNLTALREPDGEKLWKLRVGGAIGQILPTPGGVLLSALDDFVYFHDLRNGKRYWRRRLASRPLGAGFAGKDAVLLTVSGETNGIVLNLKKGKILNQIAFGANNSATFAPLNSKETVLVSTTQGIAAYSPACLTKQNGRGSI
jgi:outer membrane protein assembly factor BamB